MCQSAIMVISRALHEVDNAELLLKIKGVIALFIQTMDVSKSQWTNFSLLNCSELVLGLFRQYTGRIPLSSIRKVCRIA